MKWSLIMKTPPDHWSDTPLPIYFQVWGVGFGECVANLLAELRHDLEPETVAEVVEHCLEAWQSKSDQVALRREIGDWENDYDIVWEEVENAD